METLILETQLRSKDRSNLLDGGITLKEQNDMEKAEFIRRCGELLRIAKPHLVSCEFMYGKDIPKSPYRRINDDDEYAVIVCENGHTYEVIISGNSLIATAAAIFTAMEGK